MERYAEPSYPYSCILELRARIEAVEAAQQPPQDKLDRLIALDADDRAPIVMPRSSADSLVERVAKAIYNVPHDSEAEARAAILEVAAWLTENYARDVASPPPCQMLRNEVNR
jgi:hypothetical protein